MDRKINLFVIHCSATAPSENIGAAEIDELHRDKGFNEIGYHKVICRDGSIEDGRDVSKQGAHAGGHNDHSIGICLVGGVKEDGKKMGDKRRTPVFNFTDRQMRALKTLLVSLNVDYPDSEILGHCDLPDVAKACPCFDVRAWLEVTS